MLKEERKHTPEILRFFQMFPGQTLLIEGRPGTGKTILSLEILREKWALCLHESDQEKLYSLFPWIKRIVPERSVVNATPKRIMMLLAQPNPRIEVRF